MTNKLNISGITKEELTNRVYEALCDVNGSPIVKNKRSIVNKAMVKILHGGHGAGQNEHNLDQFFETQPEERVYYEVIENIYYEEGNIADGFCTHTGETEELALRAMHVSVIESLDNDLSYILKTEQVVEHFNNHGIDVSELNFMKHRYDSFEKFDQEDLEDFFSHISIENTNTISILFDLVFDLRSISGTYEVEEKTEKVRIEKVIEKIEVIKEAETPKIYTTIVQYMTGDSFLGTTPISEVEVLNTLSEEEHDKQLVNLFRQYAPKDESNKYLLVEHPIFDELQEELEIEDSEIEDITCDNIIDLMCKNVRPNQLIEYIKIFSEGMVIVNVQYS